MKKNFLKSVSLVLILNLLGKAIGFLKQIVLAHQFGANTNTDTFFTSLFFANEIASAFFAGAGIVALSMYGKIKSKKTDTNSFYTFILSRSLLLGIAITGLIFLFADYIATVIAPGYAQEAKQEVARYLRLLSPIALVYGVIIIKNSILEYEKKFLPAKTLSIILNSSIVISAILFSNSYGLPAIAISVIAAYLIQLLISSLATKKYAKLSLNSKLEKAERKSFIKLYLPLFLSSAITEINSIVDRAIASNLTNGSVSSIAYGASINEIVTVLVIGSIGQVTYSYISSTLNESNTPRLKNYTSNILKHLVLIAAPLTLIFTFGARFITRLVFMHGQFGENEVTITSLVIIGYAIGFIPYAIRAILLKVEYAYHDNWGALMNGVLTVLSNIIFSIILSNTIGLIGIPIATSISYFISAVHCTLRVKKIFNSQARPIRK